MGQNHQKGENGKHDQNANTAKLATMDDLPKMTRMEKLGSIWARNGQKTKMPIKSHEN